MKGLKRMKIKTKIWVLFLACILMSSVISIGTVVYSSQKSNLKHIGEMTTQTLHAIDSNLELMIDHVNQDTYAVFWSKMFQDTLEEVSKGNLTVKTRTELQDCLTNIMLAGDYISSIVFYDNIGNSFMCNREEVVSKKEIAVEDAYWYEKAIKRMGTGSLRQMVEESSAIKAKQKYSLHDPCDQEKNRLFQIGNPHGKYR